MSRSNPKRRILIVGEGRETEYNYFVGFRNVFERELEAAAVSIGVQSNERCPIGGNWKPLGRTSISEFSKGDLLPQLNSEIVVWQLMA